MPKFVIYGVYDNGNEPVYYVYYGGFAHGFADWSGSRENAVKLDASEVADAAVKIRLSADNAKPTWFGYYVWVVEPAP